MAGEPRTPGPFDLAKEIKRCVEEEARAYWPGATVGGVALLKAGKVRVVVDLRLLSFTVEEGASVEVPGTQCRLVQRRTAPLPLAQLVCDVEAETAAEVCRAVVEAVRRAVLPYTTASLA